MTTVFAHHDKSGRVHSLVSFEGVEGLNQLRELVNETRVEGSGEVKRLVK